MQVTLLRVAAAVATFITIGCGEGSRVPESAPEVSAANTTAAVVTPVAATSSATPTTAFWPHWRGPQGDGIAREALPADWPAAGLPEVWRAQIGIGFSSMAIAEGRLFAMGWKNDSETLFCLDPLTGKELWKHTYPGKKIDNLHDGGPGATPTIDSDFVYSLGREGQLFCLQAATGEVVWQKNLPQETGVPVPEWGFTSSPLIEQDLVIVDGGRVVAFDKRTGKKVWQTDAFRPGYGTAVAFTRNDERHVAVFNNDCLLVVKASNGEEVTRYPWESSYATTSTTPIVHEDTIFVSSGYGRGGALLKWNGDELEEVYDNKNMANHFNNSVLVDGHLYGIDGNTHNARLGKIVCMEHATGKLKWSQRGCGIGSLLVADDKCLVLTDEGELIVCQASPEKYQELAKARILEGLCWTVPVLAGGHIYARNAAGDLVCVKLP